MGWWAGIVAVVAALTLLIRWTLAAHDHREDAFTQKCQARDGNTKILTGGRGQVYLCLTEDGRVLDAQ